MFEKHSAVNLTTDETDLTDNYQVIIAARQDIRAIRVIRVQEKIIRSIRTIRVQEKTLSGESEHESTELANHVDLPQGKSIRVIRFQSCSPPQYLTALHAATRVGDN